MRTPCCYSCLAFVLKFLNFLQAFLGVAIVVYSAFVLNQWQHHHKQPPPPVAVNPMNIASGVFSFGDESLHFNFDSLPAPWFIYAFMGIGILICCIAFIGHIGAEAINGCCLCFVSLLIFTYAMLATTFIVLEAGLMIFVTLDHHWEKDIPLDPTGALDNMRKFIEENVDVVQWVGIAVIAIQVLSILLAITLRSLVSRPREDDDFEADYSYRAGNREPLLGSYSNQATGSPRGDSDIWSSRMRAKYGLHGGDAKHNVHSPNTSADIKP